VVDRWSVEMYRFGLALERVMYLYYGGQEGG